jgi:hypothetical protein
MWLGGLLVDINMDININTCGVGMGRGRVYPSVWNSNSGPPPTGYVVWKNFESDWMQGTPPPCFPFPFERILDIKYLLFNQDWLGMNWIDQRVEGWSSTSTRPLRHDCLMKLKLELGSFGQLVRCGLRVVM